MASDAFFPFRDGLDVAAEYGIRASSTGGSKRIPKSSPRRTEHASPWSSPACATSVIDAGMKVLIIGGGGREHAQA